MGMLFITFLGIQIDRSIIQKNHFLVLALNVALPPVFFFLLQPFDDTVALATLVIGLAPTAAASPVVASFFKAKVETVTASVLVTSPGIALLLPFILPQLISVEQPIPVWEIMRPILQIVFIPLGLSLIAKQIAPSIIPFFKKYNKLPFALFLVNIYIASAKATNFISEEMQSSWMVLVWIALAVGGLCILNFLIGERLGPGGRSIEYSLALGRKNTMFSIWLSLTFLSPIVALGPMFYVLWQNAYNSWQLYERGGEL